MAKIDFSQVITVQEGAVSGLSQTKQEAGQVLATAIETAMMRHAAPVPLVEMLTWGAKEFAARAILAAPDAEPDPLLMAEAKITGESVASLARRIVTNAEAHRIVVSHLTGVRRKALAGIAAATDAKAVAAALEDAAALIANI